MIKGVFMSEEEKKAVSVSMFTLGTGKKIYLREPEIGDTEHAMKIAGKEAGPENEGYLSILFQKEMIKLLLVKVNDQVLGMADRQQLKKLFTFKEYIQLGKAAKALLGDEGNFDLTPEHTTL